MTIEWAEADFTWDCEPLPGLPILYWPDGTLCEPVTRVFAYRAINTRVMISSLVTEIYAIREWLVYLHNRKIAWDMPSDALMSEWQLSQKDRAGEIRISYKLNCVFNFYYYSRFAIQFQSGGERMPCFTNDPFTHTDGRNYPIFAALRVRRKKPPIACWARRKSVPPSATKLPAPSEKTVDTFLGSLRARKDSPGRKFGRPPFQDNIKRLVSIRDWMIARCESGAMLRAMEVSNLTVSDVNASLSTTGLLPLKKEGMSTSADLRCLDYPSQNHLLDKLDELESLGRSNVYVVVHGKGAKARKAPFPIALIRDLLQYVLWDVRSLQVANWSRSVPGYLESEQVFLSFETRDGLSERSIANLIKRAAKAANLKISGHLLRHYGATRGAIRVWDEELRKSDYVLTSHTSSNVEERFADEMGHASHSTGVRFYVDMGQLEAHSEANLRSVDGYRRTMETLRRRRKALSEADFDIITDIVAALTNNGPVSSFHDIIKMALADPETNPPPVAPPRNERRRFRIIK